MKIHSYIVLLLFAVSNFLNAQSALDIDKVKQVLQTQQVAWNEGNIDRFMQGYWKSDSLTFIGKKGITKGLQQTFDNYQKSYPDRKTMGKLQFDILAIEQFSETTIQVIGKWALTREQSVGNIGGHFTLIFKRISNQWVIVSDHTS